MSLAAAYGVLAAILVTLSKFNKKDLPEWPYSLNLNSLVAIYTTIFRALLMFIVAEVIGQTRWPWFRQPRPLRHLDTFDNATRGAWGSLQLLFISFRPNLPFLAALTTIIALAIGPFAQQAVKTTLCEHELNGIAAQIPIANKIGSDEITRGSTGMDLNFQPESHHALLSGVLGPPSSSLASTLNSTCSTGNCTFPVFGKVAYSSLGICSRCVNVTATIRESGCANDVRNCNYTISPANSPSTWLRSYYSRLNLTSTGTDRNRYNLLNTTLLLTTQTGCDGNKCPKHENAPRLLYTNMIGAQCSLYSCIKQYTGEIRGGELSETVISTTALQPNGSEIQVDPYSGITMPCIIDKTLYDSSNISVALAKYNKTTVIFGGVATEVPLACVFQLHIVWMDSLAQSVQETLSGSCGSFCPANKWWLSRFWQNGTATLESIERRFEDIATSLTNRLRSIGLSGESLDPVEGPVQRAFVLGTTQSTTICIQFEWEWVLLPAGVALVTSALLAAAIFNTHRHGGREPAWKSSSLPLLFHGFREVDFLPPDHRMSLDEMESRADKMLVRYDADEHGGCGISSATGPQSIAFKEREPGQSRLAFRKRLGQEPSGPSPEG